MTRDRRLKSALVVAASGAIGITLTFPLVELGPSLWAVPCLAMGVLALWRGQFRLPEAIGAAGLVIGLVLLVRIPMVRVYDDGRPFPFLAGAARFAVGPWWRAWRHHGHLVVDGSDGTFDPACDPVKFGAWELVAVGALSVGLGAWAAGLRGSLAGLRAALLWVVVFVVRFALVTLWLASTPQVLVAADVTPVRLFWSPALVAPWILAGALPVAWACCRRGPPS